MATLGNTNIEATTGNDASDYLDVTGPFTATENGTITKLTGYVSGNGTGTVNLYGAVYINNAGTPGALVAASSLVTFDAATTPFGWMDLPTSGNIVSGTGYFLGYLFATGTGGSNLAWYKYQGSSGTGKYKTGQASVPDPFPASPSSWTGTFSLYATYTPAVGAPPNDLDAIKPNFIYLRENR